MCALSGECRDRQDPHNRVDAAATVRRTRLQSAERKLERTVWGRRSIGGEGAERHNCYTILASRKTWPSKRNGIRFLLPVRDFRPGQPGQTLRHYETQLRECGC